MVKSGIKRKGSSTGKKAPADFKRLKAKVGKKATQAANETNTTFRKNSIYVAGRSMQTKSADGIMSARGKSIVELSVSMGHPSGTARHSAIKGFINIVKENPVITLRAHLYILLQSASRALVDEDYEVRASGYVVLDEILSRFDRPTLAPFISLLVAYASSALHSLDPAMRFDGAKIVNLLCSFFQSMMSDHSFSLLPPFVNLLSDRAISKDLLSLLLTSLVAILSTLSPNNKSFDHDNSSQGEHQTEFLFLEGGRSTNAFLLQQRRNSQLCSGFDCLDEVVTFKKFTSISEKSATSASSSQVLMEIQTKLCDLLVEIIEDDRDESARTKMKLSQDETKAAILSLHLVSSTQIACGFTDLKQKDRLFARTTKLLMELFPVITDVQRGGTVADDHASVNVWITRTVLLLVLSSENSERIEASKVYIDKMLAHWIDGVPGGNDQDSMSPTQVLIITELLEALSRQRIKFAGLRMRIHHELYQKFFDRPSNDVARSLAGRTAAILLAKECQKYIAQDKLDTSEERLLVKSEKTLPFYLQAWHADFQNESYLIINALRWMACRMLKHDDDVTLQELREKLIAILEKQTASQSMFEQYPPKLQMNFLGLIRLLGRPTKLILKALATICVSSGNTLSGDGKVGRDVFITVYFIRKTVPMSDYLTFLINSVGVPRKMRESCIIGAENELESNLLLLDHRVLRASKGAIECGSERSLKMLMPQLLSWMSSVESEGPNTTSILRDRAAVCMLSMFMLDMRQTNVSHRTIPALSELLQRCIPAARNLMLFLSKNAPVCTHLEEKLLSPFVLLSQSDPVLEEEFYKIQLVSETQTTCNSGIDEAKLSTGGSVVSTFRTLLDKNRN